MLSKIERENFLSISTHFKGNKENSNFLFNSQQQKEKVIYPDHSLNLSRPLAQRIFRGRSDLDLALQAPPGLLCSLHNLLTPGYTWLLRQISKAAFRSCTKPPRFITSFSARSDPTLSAKSPLSFVDILKDKYSMCRTKKICSSNHQAGLLSYC